MRRRHAHQDEADINITPLIDVVFIMLIFFIVTTSFVKETGVEVNRPSANTAQKQQKGSILIAIRENGEVWFNKRNIEVRAVRANVERAHAENPEAGVVIIADKQSATGTLVDVMDQVKLAGVNNISIAATKPNGR